MTPVFDIAGLPITVMMIGGLTAFLLCLIMALVYSGIHRGTVWADEKQKGIGRFFNCVGFGLLPGLTVLVLFAQTTDWNRGRISASGWLKDTLFTLAGENGESLYAVCRFEAVGLLLLFALLVLWLAIRRHPLRDNGDILLVALSEIGGLLMLSDTLHGPEFLTFFGVRFGQVIAAVLLVLPLLVWTVRNIAGRKNPGTTVACWLLCAGALAAIAVREYTNLMGSDRFSLSAIQLAGTLLAELAVLRLGTVARREQM